MIFFNIKVTDFVIKITNCKKNYEAKNACMSDVAAWFLEEFGGDGCNA